MLDLRQIEHAILANGRVDGPELEALRQHVYADGKIQRREADFLVELHKRVEHRTPAFEKFFYQAIKDHILADGRIDAGEAVLFAICTQRENCIIATGDKQCLLGLREAATTDQDCEAICQTLSGKIFCFEQIIHRILGHFGFETVREKLIRGRECDAGLRLWLGSTLDANEDRFREGLTSHLDDLRRNTGNLLAP